ncbi:oxidase cueO precursor [Pyronema omphalodes]|nr:oxidase cueO precursor [Pyronema omphalodes]
MKYNFGIALTRILVATPVVFAAVDSWLSPVYNHFFDFPLPIPQEARPIATYINATTGIPIDFYEIHIRPFQYRAYPELGLANAVGYNGTAPGPTFRLTRGRETLVRFINEYNNNSAIHLHGSQSRAPFDGWAEDTIAPGQFKDYYFPNSQRGRTMWYHDHAMHITAVNAYFGQAGFYIIHDPVEEARYRLPSGKYDIPLMLASKRYQANGDLFSPAGETQSLFGDVIEVNGQPWPFLRVEPRKYRFRLLDSAISRAFRLHLELDNSTTIVPMTVVASDSGFFSEPVTVNNMFISIAERYEIIVDFSVYAGRNITMKNARNVMADEDFPGTDRVMRFVVGNVVTDNRNNGPIPSILRTQDRPRMRRTVDRHFRFERTNGQWLINGVGFSDVANRILARPPRGTTELWELENTSGGWSHPIHIHLVDFQVVSRTGRGIEPYERVAMKDVVLLGTNEVVRVLARYAPWDGVYMFHCHNMVHEDTDMMAAFNVTALADFGYPETTRFIDPMEERWRAKPYTGTDLNFIRRTLLPFYSSLDAYASLFKIDAALREYWAARAGKSVVGDASGPIQTFATRVIQGVVGDASGAIQTLATNVAQIVRPILALPDQGP